MQKIMAAAVAGLTLAGAGSAHAVVTSNVLYDNLSATTAGADAYGTDSFGSLANSFSTGSSAVSLGAVTVLLQAEVADPPGDYATVSLLADSGNNTPGATIATLGTVPDGSLTPVSTTYTFSGGEQLSADTRYWIQIVGTPASVGSWDWAVDESGTGVKGEYYSNPLGTFANDVDDEPYQMQITAAPATVSAAPEPSTWLLLLAGVGGIGLAFRQATRKHGFRFKDAFAA